MTQIKWPPTNPGRFSKGQFYTPAEVSRAIAQILGIRHAKITSDTTVYDPTCGSGSLLLKIGDEAHHSWAQYGDRVHEGSAWARHTAINTFATVKAVNVQSAAAGGNSWLGRARLRVAPSAQQVRQ